MGNTPGEDFLARQRVLVISPHPDDEAYGCAGTIAKVKALGGEAYVLFGSIGTMDHYGSDDNDDDSGMLTVSADTRLQECRAAMELLQVDDWEVMFTDDDIHMALDTVPRKELVRLIERDARLAIETIKPTMLLIPATSYNQDHEALHRACMTATRPGPRCSRHFVPLVLAYDNTSLFWAPDHERFHPDFFVDITDYLPQKLDALRTHASQMRDPLFHGSPEGLELQTRLRGREITTDSAEGFMTLRAVF
ncbi:LmbE family N-acetylglucosaminyl deacetylase [Cryobacterium sp. MP_M5]|uniref:PIG-L deacetylase family protein n=1 Tax=unclassified Cryobacterium TaxID=2649013 RepID=UPI0018C8FD45|nr:MULTISPECIES: PIG-L deacetylase family protein [unclassified Cryobacterium]MBG6057230.1 LmbE family N-acetylglucosaminyl deacetylase [Cryobacterium sp. MP_M3]MEC5175429.1 LmbE family N-acetylglucosaminyl deacetylase [Cryobacterium sp. MP_M5]